MLSVYYIGEFGELYRSSSLEDRRLPLREIIDLKQCFPLPVPTAKYASLLQAKA